jgi:hypothetical protein
LDDPAPAGIFARLALMRDPLGVVLGSRVEEIQQRFRRFCGG